MILPLPSFGSISYFKQVIANKDSITLTSGELVDRKNKRNRFSILSSHSKQQLTIPIKEPRTRKTLLETQISNEEPWQKLHWRSIQTYYNNAPFFEFYDYKIEPLFTKEYNSLYEFNKEGFLIVLDAIKVDVHWIESKKEALPIELETLPCVPYGQVFSDHLPFEDNLSILDLLFNLGPDTLAYLAATAAPSSE